MAATHLLRSGVGLNTIRPRLGHAKLDTTAIYAEIDLEAKARAIAGLGFTASEPSKPGKADEAATEYLRTLQSDRTVKRP